MPPQKKQITVVVPLDDTEPLQNALYQQYQYISGQLKAVNRQLREGAPEWARPALETSRDGWRRQLDAVNSVMNQIAPHV
jgi:hypothetical protein